MINKARLVNPADDGFSKSVVNVSPGDLNLNCFVVIISVVVVVVLVVVDVIEVVWVVLGVTVVFAGAPERIVIVVFAAFCFVAGIALVKRDRNVVFAREAGVVASAPVKRQKKTDLANCDVKFCNRILKFH